MLYKRLFILKMVALGSECGPNKGVRDVFELVQLALKFEYVAVTAGNDRLVFIVEQAFSLKVDMYESPL